MLDMLFQVSSPDQRLLLCVLGGNLRGRWCDERPIKVVCRYICTCTTHTSDRCADSRGEDHTYNTSNTIRRTYVPYTLEYHSKTACAKRSSIRVVTFRQGTREHAHTAAYKSLPATCNYALLGHTDRVSLLCDVEKSQRWVVAQVLCCIQFVIATIILSLAAK